MPRSYIRVKSSLTEEQQNLIVENMDVAKRMAVAIWQASSLPGTNLEELIGESLFQLCFVVLRYRPGKMEFKEVMGFQLQKLLWRHVRWLRGWKQLDREELVTFKPDSEEEEACADTLLKLFPFLSERQREVVELRYGLDGRGERSQLEIAKILQTHQSNVCRILTRANEVMRNQVV